MSTATELMLASINFADMQRVQELRACAIIPETPRPITEGGWEATDWSECPLALSYGVPGDTRSSRRRPWYKAREA